MKKEEFISKYIENARNNLEYILADKEEGEEDELIEYVKNFINDSEKRL